MKKIILFIIFTSLCIPFSLSSADASLVSDKNYRSQQYKDYRQETKKIKELFKVHNAFANKHDLSSLKTLYTDNYVDNDGFNKTVYFKSIEETWKECKNITYSTKILSIKMDGDYASVNVEETATGTIMDLLELEPIAGEIHSKSTGIYYLTKVNDKWMISGENSLTDESSLLYGDARFMNIEIQAPNQVAAGDSYTATVKIDANENTFIIGSIDRDPVTFPSGSPNSKLRAIPQSQTLERIFKSNTDNLNEYTIASLAISKVNNANSNTKIYMAGLACVMKRINVVPKNNFIQLEQESEGNENENVNM